MLLLAHVVATAVSPAESYVPWALLWWNPILSWGTWLYLPLLVWMVWWCLRNDPERGIWLWIILLFQPLGVVIYFLARWIPAANLQPPGFLQSLTRGREIRQLQIAASQIGNPHQFIELGDALRETGRIEEASTAYESALRKDPDNLQALWGAGWVLFQEKKYEPALQRLSRLIELDPAYKFGDVSLLYAKTLRCLRQNDACERHLVNHIRRWRHPEALYLLACLLSDRGEVDGAREQLNALIMDVDSSPRAIARKQMVWKSRARRMLKRLPS